MPIINKGTAFSNGEQLTADKLNDLVDLATFDQSATDSASTTVNTSGQIVVKDSGVSTAKIAAGAVTTAKILDANVTPAKLSTGAPQWDATGDVAIQSQTVASDTYKLKISAYRPNIVLEDISISQSDFQLKADQGSLTINTGDASSGGVLSTERMRIDSDGNLLVGTTDKNPDDNGATPGIAFHGSGSGQAGLIASARVDNAVAAFNRIGTNGSVVNLRKSGVGVGSISVTASATAYNTSSDYRLKEDITSIDNSIERLKQLKPCNFAWKSDGTRVDGFLAHEAQEVVPEAVIGNKDAVDEEGNPDYQGIDQSKLVPLLTKALQEAIARIEILEAK